MFYFTGDTSIPNIATNTFLPGAVADHMTSYGGVLNEDEGQMSILRWLSGGATASYGTVVEPAAWVEKFPEASVLMRHYFLGNTALEAYWKSVRRSVNYARGAIIIETTSLVPGQQYQIEAADQESGPFAVVQNGISVSALQTATLTIQNATRKVYRLIKTP